MSEQIEHNELLRMTAQIVASYVSHNGTEAAAIPNLVGSVYGSLKGAGVPVEEPVAALEPAVPVKKSFGKEHVVCLECGAKMKMLRRHLQSAHGMTVPEYRARWGLSENHPIVATNYSSHRSDLAKKIGLGSRNKT